MANDYLHLTDMSLSQHKIITVFVF